MNVLLVSIFEGGYQPITISTAYQALVGEVAVTDIEVLDIYVHGPDESKIRDRDLIFISLPLFDAVMPGVELLATIRRLNPDVKVCFYGQHATIHAARLTETGADFCILGDWELPMQSLVNAISAGGRGPLQGVMNRGDLTEPAPFFSKKGFSVPERHVLPPLEKYPNKQLNKLLGKDVIVGSTELARGCKHKCLYCSVYAAYDGRVIKIPVDIITEDVKNMVYGGMTHLTFIDADWFSSRHYGIEILTELHKTHPELTFDITTRVDHIIENESRMELLRDLNVRIITSALEFPSENVLKIFNKQVTVSDTEKAIRIMKSSGIMLNPTFIMYNPWAGIRDMEHFHEWIDGVNLRDDIDPIQFETRLSLYKGSPLLLSDDIKNVSLIEHDFHYDWAHSDPWVDELYAASVTPAEKGVFKRCCLKC
ncbi:arsinothricin biosynthesis radical SAM protein ArsL [Pectobacterium carotovorum]|uniref:arsinothricin biosynthesis radical SAM protein ArsL n=1 Tax=Pectobacterium carotovorum TaxID=554 RepID=UPI0021C401EF|nr:RCCLKC-tail radical SAM protein [Pectobacterium carotovorum]GKW07622.1 radical SAM protein [Pectobacterium carotovorum subsp. carotovorum]